MPAAKKPASKTKTAAKPTAAKKTAKTTVKRAPAKSRSTTTVKKVTNPSSVRSFRATPRTEPFFTFRITHQTLYWVILAVIVVSLAAWVLSISIKVQHIYDQIDAANQASYEVPGVAPRAH